MKKFFDLDNPVMRFLSKMADLLWLNILVLVCCLPVITAGAAFTALHFVCLKMVRGEEGYITKDFFRSFKQNFKQATIIWIIALIVGALVVFDFWYVFFSGLYTNSNTIFLVGLSITAILLVFTLAFVFPVLSHFENSVRKTIKNAFLMSVVVLPRTILIIAMWAVPFAVWYFVERAVMLCWLFWFSFPAYVAALLYNKVFKKYEPEKEEAPDDFSWTVQPLEEENGDGNGIDIESSLEDVGGTSESVSETKEETDGGV